MYETLKKIVSTPVADRPSEEEAKEAVRTLLRWAGDDATRAVLSAVGDAEVLLFEGNGRIQKHHHDFREFHRAKPV